MAEIIQDEKKKRNLSPEAKQRIADAQKKRWANRTPKAKAAKKKAKRVKKSKGPQGLGEFVAREAEAKGNKLPEANETLATQLDKANKQIDTIDSELDRANNAVDDLKAILEREYQYHSLRAEELERELLRYDVDFES